jgi:hypothetical protein
MAICDDGILAGASGGFCVWPRQKKSAATLSASTAAIASKVGLKLWR